MVDLALAQEVDALTWAMDCSGMMPDFGWWLRRARPSMRWDAPHFLLMQDRLDRMTAGEIDKALFNVAVRHGKTEHNTIGYGAYLFDRDRTVRSIYATYNQDNAKHLSKSVRALVESRGIATEGGMLHWYTDEGGYAIFVGTGVGVASKNADHIFIDDPLGNRAEAESKAHRDRVWDWLTGDILARAEPGTNVSFSMPRWNQDDPAGRLRDRQGDMWEIVDLPGLAEDDDPLGRQVGEALWPDERPREWMEEQRTTLGPYNFASLVQGRPRPREGGMFKWDWWQEIDQVPAVGRFVRYWDTAGTDTTGDNDPDYTVGALLCRMPDKRTAIVDIERFRLSVAARDARMEQIARQDLQRYGGKVRWWIETESGIGGTDRTRHLIRRLQNTGLSAKADPRPTKNKVLRAEPIASKAEAGNMVLCPGEWRNDFRLEAADFPGGRHDDQIDAVAGADSKLAVQGSAVVGTLRQ